MSALAQPRFSHDEGRSESAIRKAWEEYLTLGEIRSPIVRDVIGASWKRSRENGVNPQQLRAPLETADDRIEELKYRHRYLMDAASETVGQVSMQVEGSGIIVLVSDPTGVILATSGDPSTLDSAREKHIMLGGNWNEASSGTNAVGCALALGQPVLVRASEHFCEGVKSWSCAASVIRDPLDGSILGVLDISGMDQRFDLQGPRLALLGSRLIELALAERAWTHRARLLECYIERSEGLPNDGLMLLDRSGRMICANSYARRALEATGVSRDNPQFGLTAASGWGAGGGSNGDKQNNENDNPVRQLEHIRYGDVDIGSLVIMPYRSRRPKLATVRSEAFQAIVGCSEALQGAVELAHRFANSGLPVLLTGETGTGKEVFSRCIHNAGPRANAPFIGVNCGAVPKDLLASELFGYAAGAFTGAKRAGMPGKFELANGGTLLLDEIGAMPFDLQAYLLRVLEERTVTRLGDTQERPLNLRILSATSRDLRAAVAEGQFREDLYYRLAGAEITLPPLRERLEDIEELTIYFLAQCSERHGVKKTMSPEAMTALLRYRWLGNVRELRNAVEHAFALSDLDILDTEYLPPAIRSAWEARAPVVATAVSLLSAPASIAYTMRERAECDLIIDVLTTEDGNLSRVAKRLSMSRTTLYRRLERYGLEGFSKQLSAARQRHATVRRPGRVN